MPVVGPTLQFMAARGVPYGTEGAFLDFLMTPFLFLQETGAGQIPPAAGEDRTELEYH